MKKLMKPCQQCGGMFIKHYSTSVKQWNMRVRYCSRACRAKFLSNSPEWIRKQSESHKGKKNPHTTEWNSKISASLWKGGKPKCEICDKQLAAYGAKRCRKHANWKGREKSRCLVCQKELANYTTKHCQEHVPPSNWKGEKASYHAMHAWVARHRGKPQKCEHCGTTEKKMYHWANKSHEYKRDLNDWIRLCRPCHSRYDKLQS